MAKSIFITGGGSGIGRAVAQLFAERGWRVGLGDVNAQGLAETAALLPAGMAGTHVMDVRDRDGWAGALDAFTAPDGGRLDALFNNAGIAVGGTLADTPFDAIDRVLAVNLTGVLNGAKIAYPHLRAAPGSCLLNTASAAGIYGNPGMAAYSASKAAVLSITEALDGEWIGDDIRVRALMPSFIDTPLLDAGLAGSNRNVRETVRGWGLEFTPLDSVAQAAWDAVHGERLHTPVGKTARRLWFARRWLPGSLRTQMQASGKRAKRARKGGVA